MEELRRALEAARAETAALRAAAEGADRAPRGNDTGDAGEADSAYRATYDDGYAETRAGGTRADGHAGPNARQGANTAPVKGDQGDFISRYGDQPVQQAQWHGRVYWTPPRELLLRRECCRP